MSRYINFNGTIAAATEAVLTADNRGFKYGDGLFESMRYLKGTLKFADLHAERLQRGMRALKMDGWEKMNARFLAEVTESLVRQNRLGANARVRITVFRNPGGLYSPSDNGSGYVVEAEKSDESSYKSSSKGYIADVFTELHKPVNFLSNFKTCNSLIYVLAGIFRTQNALDDVLILNQHGFLCETMTSNLFVVYDKQIYTPALSEGCVAGVMRQVVMSLARKNDLRVVEAQINPAILHEADELFTTNAVRGIQWIMGLDRKRYFNETSKFLLQQLNGI
ncbi:aminotransferase class IV [Hufsiella ginkgonis]|uniref:branched-chain-amino-acid transaminase n=1 Tax=Hufsiella ginkgonis TaxID=2695274 RepID=A0A7K1XY07_9SPHI|nr:aminotransferase class IV [Hufsiella ginkgonis]MXV15823.1 4-amino-4-deoxychorismate lyase [Hufsiella ginkgonis]